MGLLDIGLENNLGSGMADKAAQKLSGREKQLKEQECQALGMEFNSETGTCVKPGSYEPTLE